MSQLAHDFYASNPLLFMPLFALVTFVTVFFGIIARAFFTRADELETSARLPFEGKDASHD